MRAFNRDRIQLAMRQEDGAAINILPLAKPTFGQYSVTLKKAVSIVKCLQNVSAYDNGAANDYRQLNVKIQLDQGQAFLFGEWLTYLQASLAKFVLQVPPNSGFHPAGPDYRDSGNFLFDWAEHPKFSAMKLNPYGKIDCTFSMIITPDRNAPYTPPQGLPKDLGGHFAFGAVDGLRDPIIAPTQEWGDKRGISVNGAVDSVLSPTNEYTSQLTIRTTRDKMALLIDYIQKNRGEYIPVAAGQNYFIWGGQEIHTPRQYQVKLLDSNFIFTHIGYDLWSVPVQIWRGEAE